MIGIKVAYLDEIRRFQVDIGNKNENANPFNELRQTLTRLFDSLGHLSLRLESIQLRWLDDEGDMITVSSESEFTEAVTAMSNQTQGPHVQNRVPRFEVVAPIASTSSITAPTAVATSVPVATRATTISAGLPTATTCGVPVQGVASGPFNGFVRGYAYTSDGRYLFETLEEAFAAASNTAECRAVTKDIAGNYTLRKKRNLWRSTAGELTWVLNSEEVRLSNLLKKDLHSKNIEDNNFRPSNLKKCGAKKAVAKDANSVRLDFQGPYPGELEEYAYTNDGRCSFDSFEAAAAAAFKCIKCRGITQEASTGKFTLRTRKVLKPGNDTTWVVRGKDVRMGPRDSLFRNIDPTVGAAPEHKLPAALAENLRGPLPAFLGGIVGGKQYSTLEEAATAAATSKKVRGITKDTSGMYTLRKGPKLQPTESGELSWVMKRSGVFIRPKFAYFGNEKNGAVVTGGDSDVDEQEDRGSSDAEVCVDSAASDSQKAVASASVPSTADSVTTGSSADSSIFEWVHGPYEGRLREYAYTADGQHAFTSLQDAVQAARLVKRCSGVTQEGARLFTLRRCSNLKPSATGELTWVLKNASVNIHPPNEGTKKEKKASKNMKKGAATQDGKAGEKTIETAVVAVATADKSDADMELLADGADYIDLGEIQLSDFD